MTWRALSLEIAAEMRELSEHERIETLYTLGSVTVAERRDREVARTGRREHHLRDAKRKRRAAYAERCAMLEREGRIKELRRYQAICRAKHKPLT